MLWFIFTIFLFMPRLSPQPPPPPPLSSISCLSVQIYSNCSLCSFFLLFPSTIFVGQQTTNLFYLNKNSPQGCDRQRGEGNTRRGTSLVCCYFWARLENLFLMPSGLERRAEAAGTRQGQGQGLGQAVFGVSVSGKAKLSCPPT